MTQVQTDPVIAVPPDFYTYEPAPIASVRQEDDFVEVQWPDGIELSCHRFWLRENAVGQGGVDPATREGIMDPAELSDTLEIQALAITTGGNLSVLWSPDGVESCYHGGWLRHVAEGQHQPTSWLPEPTVWAQAELPVAPRRHARQALTCDATLAGMLNDLLRYGVCVLEQAPTEEGFLERLAARIGPIRDSNFGLLWDVRADVNLAGDAKTNTTANTGFRLGPHTDLPTREIPPGFQFLHCLVNAAEGGESTLTDGAALVEELKHSAPEDFELLTSCNWIFFNRGPGIDHRWSAPIIDYRVGGELPTIRAFYPVRAFPDMAKNRVASAYYALRRFHRLADDPRFELTFRLQPGEIMCFDNRRIMHGRKAFSGNGGRHLQGIYIDRDEILSRARALNRAAGAEAPGE